MKKVSALLLTAVLGSSMVFAGISGTVTTTFGYNLDTQYLGFTNGNDVEADFSFTTEGEAISEGDIHAEISANLTILVDGLTQTDPQVAAFGVDDYDLSAKVVGPNWYVEIQGADDIADYASDIDADDDGNAFHDWSFSSSDAQGVTMGYTYEEGKTVVVSVGSENKFSTVENYKNYVAIASPSYMLAEGLAVEGAVALQKSTADGTAVAGGLQVTLSDEDMGYSVVAAADMGYAGSPKKFDIEASMVGTYSIATVEAYFATTAVFDEDSDYGDADEYTFNLASGSNLLSAQLTLDLSETVPVSVNVEFFGMDVDTWYDGDNDVYTNDTHTDAQYRMNAGIDYTLSMEDASVVIGLDGGLNFEKSDDWKIGTELAYTPSTSAYTATVGVDYYNGAGLATESLIKPSASIETTTLISGATLTFEYTDGVFNLDDSTKNDNGAIVLTCEIEL